MTPKKGSDTTFNFANAIAAFMTPKNGSNTTGKKGSPKLIHLESPSTGPLNTRTQFTYHPGLPITKRKFSAESMDETGASKKGKGKEPEHLQPNAEVPTPPEASNATETPKPPIQRPKWEKLIPRMSPVLGPQYQVRAQANPHPDEATQSKQGEENNKRVKAMFLKQYIPHTAHDINLVFWANEQLEPEKRIHPPLEGTKEFKYIKEQTVAWSERRKCQLLNIFPGDAGNVVHKPKCHEEVAFLRRHVKKQTQAPYLRTTPGTDGVHPERTFNGLMSEEEWKQTTLRDMDEWRIAPPYIMSNGQGKKTELSKNDAYTAQSRGYNTEFKTGATGMFRRHFFPASHHTELVGEEEMAVLQGQEFKIWKEGELMEGVRKDSEIDWVDAGATMQAGDSLFWEEDEVFEGNGRVGGSGEWVSAGGANEDAFKRFMGDVDLSGERYVHRPVGRYRERDLVKEEEDLERLKGVEHQGM